ncbi:P-loop ATPase, Sll1717 family [Marichromatium sp. AB32]|uniref:P-loop ATPase, Sll1717 family n=1 Tax=Marichromatium sp. AB32 TaxID=2483363 RepID=UPI0011CD8B4B|nr:hypothetical protein [Marichromatium sp. AB32]
MSKMDTLKKYFPTGTTEGDRRLLDRIFIAPEQLPEVLAVPTGSPRVLVGNKGVGKTAILEWLFAAAKKKQIPTIFLRPDDLDLASIANVSDVSSIKRGMYDCFLDAVASAIGQKLSGLLKGSAAKLYKESVARGAREEDWMEKLLTLLSKLSKPVAQIDASDLARDLAKQSLSTERLADVVQSYLFSEKRLFLILIDDTDQVATLDDPQHLNRLWGLLLAVRKLTSTNPKIKCVVTLRTEVWMRLLRNEKGQRDQIDHFRPLVMFLRAPEELIKSILKKRLALAAAEDRFNGSVPIRHFFDDEWMNLPTSDERRSWEQFLTKSSRERPRDMIQLVNHLASAAKARNSDHIGSADAETAMETYSKERAEDLAIEMGFDCPGFLDVVRSFSDVDFESDFETVRQHLRSVPSRFSLKIGARVVKPEDDDDALLLLSLLHESGFLNARVPDSRKTDNYRHIGFLDDPHLVQPSRWNELQRARWEVHPAFRSYLIALQKERSWRSGKKG